MIAAATNAKALSQHYIVEAAISALVICAVCARAIALKQNNNPARLFGEGSVGGRGTSGTARESAS